jgi:hypothetical protein
MKGFVVLPRRRERTFFSQSDAEGTVAGRRRQSRLRRVMNLFRKCDLVHTETNQVAS